MKGADDANDRKPQDSCTSPTSFETLDHAMTEKESLQHRFSVNYN